MGAGENHSQQAARYIAPHRPAAMRWLFAQMVAYGEPPLESYRKAFEKILEQEKPTPDEAEVRKRIRSLMRTKTYRKHYFQFFDDLRAIQRVTLEQWMSKMASIRETCEKKGDMKATVRAHELIAKALGFFIERHVHTHVEMTREEAMFELTRLAKEHPNIFGELVAPQEHEIIDAEIVEPEQEHECVEI